MHEGLHRYNPPGPRCTLAPAPGVPPPRPPRPGRQPCRRSGSGRAPGQFLKEVRQELTKVDWPTRRELVSDPIGSVITVLTTYVFGLDSLFTRFVFNVLGD